MRKVSRIVKNCSPIPYYVELINVQQTPIIGHLAFYFLLCSPASQFGLVSLLSIDVLLVFVSGHTMFFPFLCHIVHRNSVFGPRFCANKIISYHTRIISEKSMNEKTIKSGTSILLLFASCATE